MPAEAFSRLNSLSSARSFTTVFPNLTLEPNLTFARSALLRLVLGEPCQENQHAMQLDS
jgi:hypothetical protein